MTIKNKRKNQKKYWNSLRGQSELFGRWRQEREELLLYGNPIEVNKLKINYNIYKGKYEKS